MPRACGVTDVAVGTRRLHGMVGMVRVGGMVGVVEMDGPDARAGSNSWNG